MRITRIGIPDEAGDRARFVAGRLGVHTPDVYAACIALVLLGSELESLPDLLREKVVEVKGATLYYPRALSGDGKRPPRKKGKRHGR